jgi:hypothetical protein
MCAPYLRWREAHDFTVSVVDADGDSWLAEVLADDLKMLDRRRRFRDWVRHVDAAGGEPLPLFGSLGHVDAVGSLVEMSPLEVAA